MGAGRDDRGDRGSRAPSADAGTRGRHRGDVDAPRRGWGVLFTTESGLVKIWVRQIREGRRTIEDVPTLGNLPEMVAAALAAEE